MADVILTTTEVCEAARADWSRIDATTESDVRRQALEDGEDPHNDLPFVEPVDSIRRRLGMSQARFAAATRIPLRTLRNWEQQRTQPGGPALALLRILARAPEAALKALAD
jgi:putative transcriptional regulator